MIYDMVIVGAGPAGIGMAVEARFSGIPRERVLVIEKDRPACWSIRNHYPDNKIVTANYKGYRDVVHDGVMRIPDLTKPQTLDYFRHAIEDNDLNIRYGEAVQEVRRFTDCFLIRTDRGEYRSRVCVIAIGILGKPNRPDYKLPRTLGSRIHFDACPIFNSEVLVVGGGDSAAERVIELVKNENTATLSYRGREFSRMSMENLRIISLMERSGQLIMVKPSNIVKVERAEGRALVYFSGPNRPALSFDHIFYCLGGTTPVSFLKSTGINLDGDVPVLKGSFETNIPGLFLAGDLTAGRGGGSINWAFATARKSMLRIAEDYLADVTAGA